MSILQNSLINHLNHNIYILRELDGIGPIENRPSTNRLHHFVQKKKEKKVTCDT